MGTNQNKRLFNISLVTSALLVLTIEAASAFNPQPEPPANERATVKSMEPLDKAKNPAPPPPPDKMRKAIEPGNDEPHAIDPGDDRRPQVNQQLRR